MHTYDVEVTRDGRWWMVDVPEIDQITQARRVSEVEDMARSLIAVSTDTPLDQVAVRISSISVPTLGDVSASAHHIEELRSASERLLAEVAEASQKLAVSLTGHGVPVRDAAVLLGVSPQRVSQLANSDIS